MNLNDYLIENDRHIGDLVNLFSVGTVLDKVNGDTFPMLVGGAIGFDEPMNIMDMKINDTSYEWFESLSDTDKGTVEDVMFNLAYEDTMQEDEKLVFEEQFGNDDVFTEIDLDRDVPNG